MLGEGPGTSWEDRGTSGGGRGTSGESPGTSGEDSGTLGEGCGTLRKSPDTSKHRYLYHFIKNMFTNIIFDEQEAHIVYIFVNISVITIINTKNNGNKIN